MLLELVLQALDLVLLEIDDSGELVEGFSDEPYVLWVLHVDGFHVECGVVR